MTNLLKYKYSREKKEIGKNISDIKNCLKIISFVENIRTTRSIDKEAEWNKKYRKKKRVWKLEIKRKKKITTTLLKVLEKYIRYF